MVRVRREFDSRSGLMNLRRLIIIFLLILVSFISASPVVAKDPCTSAKDVPVCFGKKINKKLVGEGVAPTLKYVNDVVLPENGYSVVHVLLHLAGEYAYIKENSLAKTFEYMEPYAKYSKNGEYLNGFDGFYHGAITMFFELNKEKDIDELIAEICEKGLVIPGNITSNPFECYHAIGHALMHAKGNNLDEALEVCDQQKGEIKQNGCYYGVFMENAFLYAPTYHPDGQRDTALGNSMAGLCRLYSEKRAHYCAQFVGQSYLAGYPKDIKGAFVECAKVPQEYGICVHRLGVMFIPGQFVGDRKKMKEACDLAAPAYRHICMNAVEQGIILGFGGEKAKEEMRRRSSLIDFVRNILSKLPWQ